MTPERWQSVKALFEAATQRTDAERTAFIDDACAGDPALRAEVEAMLAADAKPGGLIEEPLVLLTSDAMADDAGVLMGGRRLGRYRILSLLGRGGMGEVYLAEDGSLGRKVALKVLAESSATSLATRARFSREARLASTLDHPNICTIYEIGEADNLPFISMQYVEGHTLQRIVSGRPLSVERVLSIAGQVANALAAAHARGVVHRDIKPGNIMLSASGEVKVLDFGISMSTATNGDADAASRLTGNGAWLGTPAHMSPEQARSEPVDHRSDIFSFGTVLYQMATGRPPFAGASTPEIMQAVIASPHLPASVANPDIPAQLSTIIDRALMKRPVDRYQSIEAMNAELHQLAQANESSGPRRPHWERKRSDRPAVRASSGRRSAIVAGIVVLALALGAAFTRLSDPTNPLTSVAVVPFVYEATLSADLDYLVDGIAESVTGRLSQLPQLRVMAQSTMSTYKGRKVDPRAIGRELGVQAVLTGQVVRRNDGRVVVRVELVDTEDGSRLWGAEHSSSPSDLFALPGDVALAASRELRILASGQDEQRLTRDYTRSAEAYLLYLKGRYFWNKRTAEAYGIAIEHFRGAIDHDPTFALAYSGLADSYVMMRAYGIRGHEQIIPQAKAAAEHALRIDDTLAEVHTSLGHARMFVHDWAGADAAFRRAIELNGNYATAHHWQAMYLAQVGRLEEGMAAIRRAQALDPLSLIINTEVGRMLYFMRRYDEAIAQHSKTIEMDPNFALAHLHLGSALLEKGSYQEAITEYEKASSMGGPIPAVGVVRAHARAGRTVEAKVLSNRLRAEMDQGFAPPYAMASLCTSLGDHDGALTWMEKNITDGGPWFLHVNPLWDPLRADPRFQALIRRMQHPAP